MESVLSAGDTSWVLTSAALVLLMIPGLAFFYGGMVRSKSVLNMLMMVMSALFVVGVLWIIFGYSIAFGTSNGGLFGNPTEYFGLEGLMTDDPESVLPVMAFVAFQAMFACLTVGLIAGAIPDRMKFGAWIIFGAIWAVIVYFPVAHWVWAPGGWIFELGVIDFAGGTAVHINAGAAALALAIVLGKRIGFAKGVDKPHNVPLVLLGAGLLWFGWFGFNAGSELAADGIASLAFINTIAAPAAGVLGWLLVERIKEGKATSVGAASGAVAGLVAITPACASLTPMWAIVLGLIAGAICALAIELKFKLGFDDSLDVVGIHLFGGLIGTLFIGFFATGVGLLDSGSWNQLGIQAIAAFTVMIFSFVASLIIGFAIEKSMGFRIKNEDELAGIDTVVHGEEGYSLSEV